MNVTWIGQAGLIFKTSGLTIVVDPYLSDSVKKVNPLNWRRVPVDESLFDVKPDIMIFTHCHMDHYDPETVDRFFEKNERMTILCPTSVWTEVRKHGGAHNYVQFNTGTEWTQGSVHFSAVKAEHSDAFAIGVVITAEKKSYYVAGDTLYNRDVISSVPKGVDTAFVPVNGVGNNMNGVDAARFVDAIGAKQAVALHIGLFDELTADVFPSDKKVEATIYQQIKL